MEKLIILCMLKPQATRRVGVNNGYIRRYRDLYLQGTVYSALYIVHVIYDNDYHV